MILILRTKDLYVKAVRKEEFTSFFYFVIYDKYQHTAYMNNMSA